jgi:hypothetical protein
VRVAAFAAAKKSNVGRTSLFILWKPETAVAAAATNSANATLCFPFGDSDQQNRLPILP